jgi:neutral amino acid transport system permease protein
MRRSSHEPDECWSNVGWGIIVVVESTEPPYDRHAMARAPSSEWLWCAELRMTRGKGGAGGLSKRLARKVVFRLPAIALGVLAVFSLAPGRGSAQAAESIRGRVFNEREENGKRVRDPVPGVKIAVVAVSGEAVGDATTDDKGSYEIPLPAPGDYTVKLDESTLPKDVTVRKDTPSERMVNVRPGEAQTANYFLGKDLRKQESRLSILPQTIANGLKFGLIIAICAVGLSLIYGTTGLSNFAHGELVALGAIVAWYFNQNGPQFHILIAAVLGILAATIAGGLSETLIFKPLRRKGIGLTSMMIVTIGLGISARYIFQFVFGGRSRAYRQYAVQAAKDIGPVSLTPRSMIAMTISVVAMVGVALWLLRTRTGKAIRAVSDNPDLASTTGINTDRIILIVWVVGAGLAGLGGILLGLEQQVRWDMGFSLLLLMFAAITLGGLGNPFGALVGGVLIGLFVELWTWVLPGVIELKNLGALLALILILLIRPQGILGSKERVG